MKKEKKREWKGAFKALGIVVALSVIVGGAAAVTTITDTNVTIGGVSVLLEDGSVAMTGDLDMGNQKIHTVDEIKLSGYNKPLILGNQTISPKLYSVSNSPYECIVQPSGGDSMGEFAVMPSGTNNQSAFIVWNSGDFNNGGYVYLRISADNYLVFDTGHHGTGVEPSQFWIYLDTYIQKTYTNTVDEVTPNVGVTVDNCLIKDGKVADSDKVDGIDGGDIFKKDGSVAITGNVTPNTNNTKKLGASDLFWSDIYAVNTHFGDIGFSEKSCMKSGKPFAIGDSIILKVVRFDEGDTMMVPILAEEMNTPQKRVNISVTMKEEFYAWDASSGKVITKKRTVMETVNITKTIVKEGYRLNTITGEFYTTTGRGVTHATLKDATKVVTETIEQPVYEQREIWI